MYAQRSSAVREHSYVHSVENVSDVAQRTHVELASHVARRVVSPSNGVTSWTVIGPDRRPVEDVDLFLAWLTNLEKSPNTVEAYARDLRLFFEYLERYSISWEEVGVDALADFASWARRPHENVVLLRDAEPKRSTRSVNRALTAIVAFYEFHSRRGNTLAKDLVVQTRSGQGGYKPLLHGMGTHKTRRGLAVRLPEIKEEPATLSLDQVHAVIDAQDRLRDRFLFALLASTGMRIGQALALRHSDIVPWERMIVIKARPGEGNRSRSKMGASGAVPVPKELIQLRSDYMHEEYGDVDSDYVFVNLFSEPRGRRMSYRSVDRLVEKTRKRVGFHFTPHQFRHTYATLAYRDGVALDVISVLLTHASPYSTRVYVHATAADLRSALDERGVLKKVEDLLS